jgi:hypothetical protein
MTTSVFKEVVTIGTHTDALIEVWQNRTELRIVRHGAVSTVIEFENTNDLQALGKALIAASQALDGPGKWPVKAEFIPGKG